MKRLCHVCGKPCCPGEDLVQGISVKMDDKGRLTPTTDASRDLTVHRSCIDPGVRPSLAAEPVQTDESVKTGVVIERADVLGFLA